MLENNNNWRLFKKFMNKVFYTTEIFLKRKEGI